MARNVQRYRRLKHLFILAHTKLTVKETCRQYKPKKAWFVATVKKSWFP
jgi:hypothetical protein